MTDLTDAELRALKYIENTGHTSTVAGFDEDHEPIGPALRQKLVPKYMRMYLGGELRLTEDGMELVLSQPIPDKRGE